MRRNKYDIKVYTRYYMRLVILFSILFIGVLWGPISLYCIEKKPVNVSIIVSIFFMIFFGGIALFQYIAFAPKLYVYGNKIVIKKWYGLRRKYYVKDNITHFQGIVFIFIVILSYTHKPDMVLM